jgi:hypothetical protein
MKSDYTTVLDAATPTLPALPLILMLAAPILMLACVHVGKARQWHVSKAIKLGLAAAYLSYAPAVLFQYWSLWREQTLAEEATNISVEAGPLGFATVQQAPDGLFVDTDQRFAVNGVEFTYTHRALRYFDFLLPQADLVQLPLRQHANVRITYRGEGEDRQLLRFEIATRDLDSHD